MKRLYLISILSFTFLTMTALEKNTLVNNPIIQFYGNTLSSTKNKGKEIGVPFDAFIPQHYEEAILEGIKRHQEEIDAIVNNPAPPTFENTIEALDKSGAILTGAELVLSNLESALGDTLLMEITSKVTPLLSKHSTDILLNKQLFRKIKTVHSTKGMRTDLSEEALRLIDETYKNFAESGALLEGESREKFGKLSAELSDLKVKFAQNVTNGMKAPDRRLWLTEKELEGLPESIIEAARLEAEDARNESAEKIDNDNKYLFTVYYPSYAPLMKYASNRDVRERMYKLYNSRNVGGEFDNTQILKDIANVRLEIANLLGFENYASSVLGHKMASNAENVENLLQRLREAYIPAMQKELNEITEFARLTEGSDFKLEPWDYSYWSDKLKNARYSFNDEDLRPYFELEKTIGGVLGLATKLYGYKFKENKKTPVYNQDVKAYDVYDDKGELLGLLYADFYYRTGKAPGAWMTEFRGEYRDDNGKRNIPLISIVCNFSKPAGNEPSLLTPYEVETFLHEFGHALHGLSANTKYASLSGTNVYQDFVELFSQFNENYLTQKEYLDGFARHYKTGEKIPTALLENFIKSSQYGAGYACVRQLNFGELDMAYHTIKEPLRASQSLSEFEENALKDVKLFDNVEGCLISPAFGHIFSGGYAAGYYGYKWAEVLDADAFAAFLEEGIFNKSTAKRFREMLSSGGSADPMALYVKFRGKKPSIDALLHRDGITIK